MKPDNFSETLSYKLDNLELMNAARGGDRKSSLQKEFLNVLEMCPELGALYFTLKNEDLVDETDFQAEVIRRVKSTNFEIFELANWAARMIQNIAIYSFYERNGPGKSPPEKLEGNGPTSSIMRPKGNKGLVEEDLSLRKKGALNWMTGPAKKT